MQWSRVLPPPGPGTEPLSRTLHRPSDAAGQSSTGSPPCPRHPCEVTIPALPRLSRRTPFHQPLLQRARQGGTWSCGMW